MFLLCIEVYLKCLVQNLKKRHTQKHYTLIKNSIKEYFSLSLTPFCILNIITSILCSAYPSFDCREILRGWGAQGKIHPGHDTKASQGAITYTYTQHRIFRDVCHCTTCPFGLGQETRVPSGNPP